MLILPDVALYSSAYMMQLLPWFEETARHFLQHKEQLGHAWLMTGAAGIGKFQFGQFLAASLLCEQPAAHGFACGQCGPCQWVHTGVHPDLKYIYPAALESALFPHHEGEHADEHSQEIRIEQLRALDEWFYASTHRAGFRVIIIYPAHQMNGITANALLKILEEPMPRTVFLLMSAQLPLLLPTIRSRCQLLRLPSPTHQVALSWLAKQGVAHPEQWLAAHDGAPLSAYHAAQQEEQPIPQWLQQLLMALEQRQKAALYSLLPVLESLPFGQVLTVLQRLFLDIQYCQFNLQVQHYPRLQAQLNTLAARASQHAVAFLLKNLTQAQRTAHHPFNQKLRVHHLLDQLFACFS